MAFERPKTGKSGTSFLPKDTTKSIVFYVDHERFFWSCYAFAEKIVKISDDYSFNIYVYGDITDFYSTHDRIKITQFIPDTRNDIINYRYYLSFLLNLPVFIFKIIMASVRAGPLFFPVSFLVQLGYLAGFSLYLLGLSLVNSLKFLLGQVCRIPLYLFRIVVYVFRIIFHGLRLALRILHFVTAPFRYALRAIGRLRKHLKTLRPRKKRHYAVLRIGRKHRLPADTPVHFKSAPPAATPLSARKAPMLSMRQHRLSRHESPPDRPNSQPKAFPVVYERRYQSLAFRRNPPWYMWLRPLLAVPFVGLPLLVVHEIYLFFSIGLGLSYARLVGLDTGNRHERAFVTRRPGPSLMSLLLAKYWHSSLLRRLSDRVGRVYDHLHGKLAKSLAPFVSARKPRPVAVRPRKPWLSFKNPFALRPARPRLPKHPKPAPAPSPVFAAMGRMLKRYWRSSLLRRLFFRIRHSYNIVQDVVIVLLARLDLAYKLKRLGIHTRKLWLRVKNRVTFQLRRVFFRVRHAYNIVQDAVIVQLARLDLAYKLKRLGIHSRNLKLRVKNRITYQLRRVFFRVRHAYNVVQDAVIVQLARLDLAYKFRRLGIHSRNLQLRVKNRVTFEIARYDLRNNARRAYFRTRNQIGANWSSLRIRLPALRKLKPLDRYNRRPGQVVKWLGQSIFYVVRNLLVIAALPVLWTWNLICGIAGRILMFLLRALLLPLHFVTYQLARLDLKYRVLQLYYRIRNRLVNFIAITKIYAGNPAVLAVRIFGGDRVNRYYVWRNENRAKFIEWMRPFELISQSVFILRHNRAFETLIRQNNPYCVMMLEVNCETTTHILAQDLKRHGVPSVIVPNTIPNADEPAQFYFNDPSKQVTDIGRRAMRASFPQWARKFRGKWLLRLSPQRIFTLEVLGFPCEAPWVLNRGPSKRVFLESQAMADIYRGLNFPEKQIQVVGDNAGEAMSHVLRQKAQLRTELYAAHGLDPAKGLVVCAFPPDQFDSNTENFEHKTYDELVLAWANVLRAAHSRANIVIKPHPRLNPEKLKHLADAGFTLSTQPTEELIVLADLYVACVSATIRWALAVGVPVINYDCYRYNYSDYRSATACFHGDTAGVAQKAVHDYFHDADFSGQIRKAAQDQKKYWGLVDDGLGERIIGALETLRSH